MGAWQVILGDQQGRSISNISAIAFGKQYTGTLNRPAMFTFWVPADDPRVSGLYTAGDGLPYLTETRTLRCYRQEAGGWVLRFAGHIWIVEDDGDAQTQKSAVTAYDPLLLANLRIARRMIWRASLAAASRLFVPDYYAADNSTWSFPLYDDAAATNPGAKTGGSNIVSVPGVDIARGLLNCTNYYDGFTGLDDFYPNTRANTQLPYPSGASPGNPDIRPPADPVISPTLDNKRVGEMLVSLMSQDGSFDLEVVPTDAQKATVAHCPSPFGKAGDYSGHTITNVYQTLALLKFYQPLRGANLTNIVFGWGIAPYNVAAISRVVDGSALANYGRVIGKGIRATSFSVASITNFGRVGMADPATVDITNLAMLQALAVEEVKLGGVARQTVTITPASGASPLPWDDFNLGDYVNVLAGAQLRGGFSGYQRIYGVVLDIADDSTVEILSSVVASPTA